MRKRSTEEEEEVGLGLVRIGESMNGVLKSLVMGE